MPCSGDDFVWVCNSCGSHEYTSQLGEQDIEDWLSCSSCGCDEFHKEIIGE